jgi:hypothetical protein
MDGEGQKRKDIKKENDVMQCRCDLCHQTANTEASFKVFQTGHRYVAQCKFFIQPVDLPCSSAVQCYFLSDVMSQY